MLYIHMLYSKVIDRIFSECLCFLIVAIDNSDNQTVNWFWDFIDYENFFDIDKHAECIQFIEQFEKSNDFLDSLSLIYVFSFTSR